MVCEGFQVDFKYSGAFTKQGLAISICIVKFRYLSEKGYSDTKIKLKVKGGASSKPVLFFILFSPPWITWAKLNNYTVLQEVEGAVTNKKETGCN